LACNGCAEAAPARSRDRAGSPNFKNTTTASMLFVFGL
jgi:hypothetical protein